MRWPSGSGLGALTLLAIGCSASDERSAAATDGATLAVDVQSEAPVDAMGPVSCMAAGGRCELGATCALLGPADSCGPGAATCCLDVICAPDAGVYPIQASSYDQSCTVDSDCVSVGLGNACSVCEIDCPNAAINSASLAQYRSDVARSPAAGTGCACVAPASGFLCCNAGTCDPFCQSPTDAGADAGSAPDADACVGSDGEACGRDASDAAAE